MFEIVRIRPGNDAHRIPNPRARPRADATPKSTRLEIISPHAQVLHENSRICVNCISLNKVPLKSRLALSRRKRFSLPRHHLARNIWCFHPGTDPGIRTRARLKTRTSPELHRNSRVSLSVRLVVSEFGDPWKSRPHGLASVLNCEGTGSQRQPDGPESYCVHCTRTCLSSCKLLATRFTTSLTSRPRI